MRIVRHGLRGDDASSAQSVWRGLVVFLLLALVGDGRCFLLARSSGGKRKDLQTKSAPARDLTLAAEQFGGLQEVEGACAKASAGVCVVRISTHWETELKGQHTTPPGVRFRFEAGGVWTVRGDELTIGSGSVEAGDDTQIFGDGSAIRGLDWVRPEWFGRETALGYPAEAVAQAYRSTKPWGRILLRDAAYLSPFFDAASAGFCGGKTVRYASPRNFVGVRRPWVDQDDDPHELIGGSILRGEICGTAALGAYHLGVDTGPGMVRKVFDGQEPDGIILMRAGALHEIKGTVLNDVAVLTNGRHDQHSVLIEGQDEARIQGLWVWTQGGTHGLVVKSSKSTVRDFHCKGAVSDCLIVKSDAAVDDAGYAANVDIDRVEISSLKKEGDTGGIFVDARWDDVHDVVLDHVVERGTSFGLIGLGSMFFRLDDVVLRNWEARVTGPCMDLTFATHLAASDFTCEVRGESASAFRLDGREISVSHGVVRCWWDLPQCGGRVEDGVVDLGTGTRYSGLRGERLPGFLVRSARPLPAGEGLSVSGMDDRVWVVYRSPSEPFSTVLRRWGGTLKPYLRMALTASQTLLRGRFRWISLLFLGAAGLAFLSLTRRRERGSL